MAIQQVIEGTWEEVKERHAHELSGHRVQIRVMDEEIHDESAARNGNGSPDEPKYMYFGMFQGEKDLALEDFKIAEFHGDADDGLDWNE